MILTIILVRKRTFQVAFLSTIVTKTRKSFPQLCLETLRDAAYITYELDDAFLFSIALRSSVRNPSRNSDNVTSPYAPQAVRKFSYSGGNPRRRKAIWKSAETAELIALIAQLYPVNP